MPSWPNVGHITTHCRCQPCRRYCTLATAKSSRRSDQLSRSKRRCKRGCRVKGGCERDCKMTAKHRPYSQQLRLAVARRRQTLNLQLKDTLANAHSSFDCTRRLRTLRCVSGPMSQVRQIRKVTLVRPMCWESGHAASALHCCQILRCSAG